MIEIPTSPQVECHQCGWSILLPFTSPDHVSLVPLKGWVMQSDDVVLCDRCATGWTPRQAQR